MSAPALVVDRVASLVDAESLLSDLAEGCERDGFPVWACAFRSAFGLVNEAIEAVTVAQVWDARRG